VTERGLKRLPGFSRETRQKNGHLSLRVQKKAQMPLSKGERPAERSYRRNKFFLRRLDLALGLREL
jgi:hypothetical protein